MYSKLQDGIQKREANNNNQTTPQLNLPSDIQLMNQVIEQINTYINSRKELYPKETFLLGLINPIYAYGSEREPIHCKLSPKAKVYSYLGLLQQQKLTKLPSNMPNIVSSYPLLRTTQQHSPLVFKELIQELKNKISPYVKGFETSQPSNAFAAFGRKVVKMAKDTVWHSDDHFQKLVLELNKILDNVNISQIENELTQAIDTIAANIKARPPIQLTGDFAEVPIDILYEIFKYLDVENTTKRNQICRFFNALNGNALWQSYLDRDFRETVDKQSDAYRNSPQTLYVASYLKKKHTPVMYLPLIVEPDSLHIVNKDPVRLLNRMVANNQLRNLDATMLKSSIPEAVGSIGNIMAVSYLTADEAHIRQSGYAILGFDDKAKFNNSAIFDENVARHIVEIAFTDYRFPKNVNNFADDLNLLVKNNCKLSCKHVPVRFNGKLFEKVNVPEITIENKVEQTNIKYTG